MWPEVETAKTEKRHELVLSGQVINENLTENGFDPEIFNLTNLNYLSISESKLSELLPTISNLKNLQTLVLHSNKLEKIPNEIAQLDKLKMLDLSRNLLTEVPDCIVDLLQIVTLNLSGNKIEKLPTFTKNSKLSVLDLSNNKLKQFPDVCYEELANLTELKLSFNEIEEIPCSIHNLKMIKVLDLSSNKVKNIPGELVDCSKLKEINLKLNPISDRRLFKLIDQCRTKQILDYVKQNCPRTTVIQTDGNGKKNKKSKSKSSESNTDDDDDNSNSKYTITVKRSNDNFKVIVANLVKNVREHLVCCIINNVQFTEETFKKFIQLQNKLHEGICNKRIAATVATHDLAKFPPGDLVYTATSPKELIIKPLNRVSAITGSDLFVKLQTEANNLRKEKKRNTYSGIHKYLSLIEGKPLYPCLLNGNNEVISFPPITNSDISKIQLQTKTMFVEITSSNSQQICKNVLNMLLKEMVVLFNQNLEVQQVRIVDEEDRLKLVYPSRNDLIFEKSDNIKIVREE